MSVRVGPGCFLLARFKNGLGAVVGRFEIRLGALWNWFEIGLELIWVLVGYVFVRSWFGIGFK